MKTKIINSFLAGLVLALVTLIYLLITGQKNIALFVTLFVVIFSPIIFYFKMFSKIDYSTKFLKIDKASILYSGSVNHYFEKIPIGGTLYLLNDKLIFQTNSLSFIKRHQSILNLNEIIKIDVFDNLGFIKNGFSITLKNGDEKFTSFKRQTWKQELEKKLIHQINTTANSR